MTDHRFADELIQQAQSGDAFSPSGFLVVPVAAVEAELALLPRTQARGRENRGLGASHSGARGEAHRRMIYGTRGRPRVVGIMVCAKHHHRKNIQLVCTG